jgi:hypothetical protein
MDKKYTDSAKKLEKNLSRAMEMVFFIYKVRYPTLEFKTVLSKFEIAKLRGLSNYNPQNAKSNIRPDGGMLFLDNKLVLCSEAKTQGNATNHFGNAIERSAKNYLEIKGICKNYNFLPYVIFCSGNNFKYGSSILDRIDILTDYLPRNTILSREKVASVYTKEVDFSLEEILPILTNIIEISLNNG